MLKALMSSTNLVTRTVAQFAIVAVAGTVGVTVASTASSATLDAIASNTTAQTINTATMSLLETATSTSVGFSYSPAAMVPGDSVSFNVTATNGTADSTGLYLSLADSAGGILTSSATKGLAITVTDCWNGLASPSALYGTWNLTGTCSLVGTPAGTSVLSTTVAAINTLASPTAGAEALLSGAQGPSLVRSLRFTLTLPNGTNNETVTNGVSSPAGALSIQGKSASILWRFHETQKTGVATNG